MKSIVSYQALEDIRMEFLVLVINVMKKEQYQFSSVIVIWLGCKKYNPECQWNVWTKN